MMKVFEFLAVFDWIGPLVALLETAIHGHGWTFYVDLDSGCTGAQCEKLLRSSGVKVYGRCIAHGDVFFQVPTKQAEWAEYVLLRAGVPLKYALYSERNLKYVERDARRQGQKTADGWLGLLSSLWQ